MDIKLELVAIPVTDIDRAKDFYVRLGFNADHDHTVSEDLRFVQLTPPGSACSICIGKGITDAEPGSVVGMQVVVKDIEEAEREFKSRGIDISPIETRPGDGSSTSPTPTATSGPSRRSSSRTSAAATPENRTSETKKSPA